MALGIFYAILSGLSWIAVGAVVGLAEKRGCGSTRQQLVSNTLSGTISLLVLGAGMLLRPDADAFSLRCDWPSALWMLLCGYLNFWMVVYMGKAMLRGPNGIVWTIVQSGFIFSFTLGVVMGNTRLTALNVAGAVCVFAGVVFCGQAKSAGQTAARSASGGWLGPALAGFVLCGINQCAACMATMGPVETRPTPLLRILLIVAGSLMGVLPHMFMPDIMQGKGRILPKSPAEKADLRAKYLYLLKICGIGSAIFFLSSFFFQFNAYDLLEAAGRISIVNSTMLAACLVGFGVYGAVFLHERLSPAQIFGTLFALAGIVLVSL